MDSKTWADVQSKWVEVELRRIENNAGIAKAFIELVREGMSIYKDYYLKKIPRTTIPAYLLVGAVVVGAAIPTGLGRISGETFAFLMGTIVGYIVSLLSKHL